MILKNFVDLNEIEKVLVFGWRNHLKIAPLMKTQTITLKEHLQFMESLKQDSTKQYFLALQNDEILGVLCFIDIQRGISCEFGIYQNPDLKGNGAALMQKMLQYAQETLGVKSIYACALNTNQKAISLYQRFGFQFTNKDAQMSYFVFSAGGGGFVALYILKSHFIPFFYRTNYNFSHTGFHTLQNTQILEKCGIAKLKGDSKFIFKPVRVKVA
ncbi:UDP-4-amino-4,6-dideoxy-N-acetyl-beta-L-altrosamine N-acetyltransferase [Helicobacter rodentium]|uniref:UDP-4-amino-4, 6-dideoxy-N-acetyl-beta-L-altrosamine N-acetyltransferase n=9 Tax=Helicobacter rodentium TaxID=59617 RepID=UPI00260DED49|nr:UDP-4-amino-4,6-dideoxy-N-acetyl-beta-L-altrosamine N-acetyltransferase [Helicobacter rodentium]